MLTSEHSRLLEQINFHDKQTIERIKAIIDIVAEMSLPEGVELLNTIALLLPGITLANVFKKSSEKEKVEN